MEKKVICDSDALIDYLDAALPRHLQTVQIIENKIGISNLLISAVTYMEILAGAKNLRQQKRLTKNLQGISVMLLNDAISIKAMQLFGKYHLSHSLQIPDALIAATALEIGKELFTYNLKDFRFIPGLQLFKP